MLNIGICDDKAEIINVFSSWIHEISVKNKIEITLKKFESGENLLFELDENIDFFDILYLDIEMGNLNGIETASILRDKGCQSIVIFLTDREKYVFQSFDVLPLNYILKSNITIEKFEKIFLSALEHRQKTKEDVFVCEFQDIKKIIPLIKIQYFEVQNRIVTVHYDGETFKFYSKLDTIDEELKGKWFVRIHRSFIINLRYIDHIVMKSIYLINGSELPIGSTYLPLLKRSFSDYLLEII